MKIVQVNDLINRNLRRRKLLLRIVGLSLGALLISQVFPTLADEQDQEALIEEIYQVENGDAGSLELFDNEEVVVDSQTTADEEDSEPSSEDDGELQEPLPSPTPSPKRVSLTSSQDLEIRFPSVVLVDPRATVASLPKLGVTGSDFLLICAVAEGAVLDLINVGIPDDIEASNLFLLGDLTSRILISGPSDIVLSAINPGPGMKISGLGRKLTETRLYLAFIATNGIATDDSLCNYSRFGNDRLVTFRALDLNLRLKKGRVELD
jgi:hypothetical protein